MLEQVKTQLAESLDYMTRMLLADVRAAGDEGMGALPGGLARPAYDYVYEVGLVNHRIAARLRGQNPGPWPVENGYLVATDELRSIDAISKYLTDSTEDMTAALLGATEEDLMKEHSMGDFTMTGFQLAIHSVDHLAYHMGQLNQLHMIRNDAQVHWDNL